MTPHRVAFRALPALVAALAVAPTTSAAQAASVRPLSLDHYLDMETVSSPQISPDGATIVYTRGWIDKINDRRESSLWIMSADGSRNRHLLDGGGAHRTDVTSRADPRIRPGSRAAAV